jgi:hypothetical protein
MDLKYLLKIFIVFILIFSVIIFIKSIGLNFNELKKSKTLVGSAIMEGLEPKILSGNKAFCESHKGFEQETSCNKLTNYNCNLTSCCVWTSDNKCKAGTISGPTFNSDAKGKTKKLDYYYFQNKCYGNTCPNS